MPSFLEKEKGTTDPTEKLATGEICVVDEEIGVGFGIPQIKMILVMEDGGTPCKKAKEKARGEEKEILDEGACWMPTCPVVRKNKRRGARVGIDGVQIHTRDGGGRTWAKIHPQHTLIITTKL